MSRVATITSGFAVVGLGALFTLGSYSGAASCGGGSYVLATGALIFGFSRIVRGLCAGDDIQR